MSSDTTNDVIDVADRDMIDLKIDTSNNDQDNEVDETAGGPKMSLATRMKNYEDHAEFKIDPSAPFVIRCDGHSFSTFTRGFKKPFDEVISGAMIATTEDLVQQFGAR